MAQIRWSLPVHDRGCHAKDAASSGVACNEGLSQTFEARDALAESPVLPCHHLTRSVFIIPGLESIDPSGNRSPGHVARTSCSPVALEIQSACPDWIGARLL